MGSVAIVLLDSCLTAYNPLVYCINTILNSFMQERFFIGVYDKNRFVETTCGKSQGDNTHCAYVLKRLRGAFW